MKYKIIVDSSCDLTKDYIDNSGVDFSIVPFTVNVGEKAFIDDQNLNTAELLNALEDFEGKPISACPSPQTFLDYLDGADKYFIITISSKLSGSFNSGLVAKNLFANPKDVFVIDSKQTSGSMILIVEKLVEMIKLSLPFESICEQINKFVEEKLELLFTLNDYSNLVKNGRMTTLQAVIATTLRIKPICEAQDGEIKIIKKLLGSKRLMKELVSVIAQKANKTKPSKCIITHADNLDGAEQLKKGLLAKNLFKNIKILPMKGLCSFYAMRKGLIICFEK